MQAKKTYTAPTLIAYGAVSDLTRQGGLPNSDVPKGPDGTAFSPN